MKKAISMLASVSLGVLFPFALAAQDTSPRGPSQWTARNWLGFCIQIGVFILAVIGIYRLARSGEGEGKGEGEGDDPDFIGAERNPNDPDFIGAERNSKE
ncbi:MAG: hypothetical protein V1789_05355 [PVC group bacterium]